MLDLNNSLYSSSQPVAVHPVVTQMAEGAALVSAFDGSVRKVRPSQGSANEVFVGFSVAQHVTPTTARIVEEITVPATSPYTVTLRETPRTDEIRVYDTDSGAAIAAAAAAVADDEYDLDGDVIEFNSADAGRKVTVIYSYDLTVQKAAAIYGEGISIATVATGEVGVIQEGTVFTDQYDVTKDWSTVNDGTPVTTGADGKLTIGGNGTSVSTQVVAIPSATNPFLGIRINV